MTMQCSKSDHVERPWHVAGDKVRLCGAELVANQQSEALESSKTSYLNLHANGSHRCESRFSIHECCIGIQALSRSCDVKQWNLICQQAQHVSTAHEVRYIYLSKFSTASFEESSVPCICFGTHSLVTGGSWATLYSACFLSNLHNTTAFAIECLQTHLLAAESV